MTVQVGAISFLRTHGNKEATAAIQIYGGKALILRQARRMIHVDLRSCGFTKFTHVFNVVIVY